MANTWFVGDLHFGHEKVAKIRGFASIEQHDLKIFDTWRRQVADDDHVIVVGDISSGREEGEHHALEILAQLPGLKTLVCGNHDSIAGIHRKYSPHTEFFRSVFESIHDFTRIRSYKQDVLVSHYPYTSQGDGPGRGEARYNEFRLADTGKFLIHAHTHHTHPTDGSVTGREFCVSWDAHRELVNIGKIDKWIQSILESQDISSPNPELVMK